MLHKSISKRLVNKLLVTIFALTIIEFLQVSMIAFAANPIMGEIGTTPEEFGLINALYAAIAIIMIAKQHWMIERLSWRRYIQLGLFFFSIGALICACSHSLMMFLVGRMIMALGGASFMTSARLVALLLPAKNQLMAIKVFVISMTTGISTAPWLASIIVSYDRWNLIFILLIFAAFIAFIFASLCLPIYVTPPEKRVTKSNPFLILVLFLGGFAFFYVFRRSSYNFYNNFIMLLGIFSLAFIFLTVFYRLLHQNPDKPLLHIKPLLQNKAFILSTLISSAYFIMNAANNYILPMMLQRGFNFPWSTIGYYNTIGLSVSILSWIIFIRLALKYPGIKKFVLVGGCAIIFYGWTLTRLTPQASLSAHILPAFIANGIFVIFFMSPVTGAGLRTLQQTPLLYIHAMQCRNMIAQLALSFGLTLGIIFTQWRTTMHFSVLGEQYFKGNAVFDDAAIKLSHALGQTLPTNILEVSVMAQLQQMLLQQATIIAGLDYFYCVMLFGLLITLFILLQKIIK